MTSAVLAKTPVHLGLGATAEIEPAFTNDMSWYQEYVSRHASDGKEGRLVSMYTFSESWDMWEMHPNGSEVVLCTAGSITMTQDRQGELSTITLEPGEFVINEPGVWHTADVHGEATAVFITAGVGTEHRPRSKS